MRQVISAHPARLVARAGALGTLTALLTFAPVSMARSTPRATPACPVPPASQRQPWLDPAYTPECRAQFVVQAIPSIPRRWPR